MGGMVLFLDEISMDNIYGNLIAVFSGLAFAALAIFMRMQKWISSGVSFSREYCNCNNRVTLYVYI